MNMARETKHVGGVGIVGIGLVVTAVFSLSGPAQAARLDLEQSVAQCAADWETAPAEDVCVAGTVTIRNKACGAFNIDCSVTATINETSVTFTSNHRALTWMDSSNLPNMDICFTPDTSATYGYRMEWSEQCGNKTGELTSAEMSGSERTPESDNQPADRTQDCQDNWDDDAPAQGYCSSETVAYSVTVSGTEADESCTVSGGSCSIDVWVDDVTTTFTPSLDNTQSVADTAKLDICFTRSTNPITATVKAGCASGEATSSQTTGQYPEIFLWTTNITVTSDTGVAVVTPTPPTTQECTDAWDDSPASDVCESDSASVSGADCVISAPSCSVTGTSPPGASATWTLSFDGATQSESDTESLDVCFTPDSLATHGYSAELKAGCDADETAAADMT